MELLGKIVVVCLLGAILSVILKKNGPELAVLLSVAVVGAVTLLLGSTIGQIVDFVRRVMDAAALLPELLAPLIKIAGIAFISRIGADLCRDAGTGALAAILETAGAFCAVLVSLPLFHAVWDILQALL